MPPQPFSEPPKKISFLRQWLSHWHYLCKSCNAYERIFPAIFAALVALALLYYFFLSGPSDSSHAIHIDRGEPLQRISAQFEEAHIVRHGWMLNLLVRGLGGGSRVRYGLYYFPHPQNVLVVAVRLLTADFQVERVRVYIPENSTVKEIAAILDKDLDPFDAEGFLALAKSREGYLYPDTYFFYPDEDPAVVESTLEDNFNAHLATIATQIAGSGKSLPQLLTMASILIGEARTEQDRRTVAGILWKRIALGIPLQVDAPFSYVFDKSLTQLTSADLKVDSPYNTYKNKGLPPTPIGNPGIGAILAAATASSSPYLFYLSGSDGTIHYSATYTQHKAQIQKYLK